MVVNYACSSLIYDCNNVYSTGHSQVVIKDKTRSKCFCFLVRDHIHDTSSVQLANRPNKLECSLLASLSSQVLCNTLAYWVDS
jgi:hypothetical protein